MTKSIEEQASEYAEKTYPIELVEFPKGHKQDVNHGRRGFSQRLFIEAAKARDEQWLKVVNELKVAMQAVQNNGARATDDKWDIIKSALAKAELMMKQMGTCNGQ